MKKVRSFFIIVLFFVGVISSSLSTQAQDADVLNLVIALDTSGSMSTAITSDNNAERVEIDAGNMLLFFGGGDRTAIRASQATDPNDLRFTTTEVILSWLANYDEYNQDIDIQVTVLSFENDVTPLISNLALGSGQAEGIQLERPDDGNGNSDFINLYQEASEIFEMTDTQSRNAFIVITDSPPCNPEGEARTDTGVAVRNTFCDNDNGVLAPHLREAPVLPPRVEEYVFYINPTGRSSESNRLSVDEYWDVYDAVRTVWNERVGSFFTDLDVVEELPALLQQSIMREVGLTLSAFDEEDVTGLALNAAQYQALGLIYSSSNRLTIPPYQSRVDLLLLPDDANAVLEFSANDEDINVNYRLNTGADLLRLAQVSQPLGGDWSIDSDGVSLEMWLIPIAARARVSLIPEQPVLYQPQRVLYQFIDDGEALSVRDVSPPDFDLVVESPSGETIPLGGLTINDAGDGFVSSQFLPTEVGQYDVELSVDVGQGGLWSADVSYDFLTPPDENLVVAPLNFVIDYQIDGVSASNVVQLPRSLPLTLELTALVDGESVVFPEGLNINVVETSPASGDDACLSDDSQPMQIAQDDMSAVYTIDFDEPGTCDVDVELSISSSLPPVNNSTIPIGTTNLDRTVIVDDTELLSVVVLDDAGRDITENASDAVDFSFNYSFNLPIGSDSTVIIVEIRDEAGESVWPVFDANAVNNQPEGCEASERIIPFELSITNNAGRDVTQDNNVCLVATDIPGQYRAEISGLGAGRYDVSVVVDRTQPRLETTQFEYDPMQFSGARTDISGILNVTVPVIIWIMVAVALVIVAVVSFITLTLINRGRKRLRGHVAFYAIASEDYQTIVEGDYVDEQLKPLWRRPWGNSITDTFRAREFLRVEHLKDLKIEELSGTTGGDPELSQANGAMITLSTRTGEISVKKLNGAKVTSGQARYIDSTGGMRIYLVQDAPDEMSPRQLLEKSPDEKI